MVAVGTLGAIYRSTDGGATWSSSNTGVSGAPAFEGVSA
jgi:photosystem II stability/assembly factor-like uncharacterized protein